MQNIFDNLNEGIVLMDMDRNIVQINRAASRLLGIKSVTLPRETIASTFVLTRLNGEHIPQVQWPSSLALNGVYIENCELRVRRTDTGDTNISQISTSPVLDESGKAIQIILSYRDITRPKEISEDRTRLAEIIDSSEDAIIGKDNMGMITSWNMGAEKIFGYAAAEIVGQSVTYLLPDDRLDEESNILDRIRRGEMVDHIETVRKRKNGQFIDVSLTISPIRNASGAIVGASKVARNISDRKKLERQLHQSQKMDAIGQLTGGIAHDFNNLLGIVIGNFDLLEEAIPSNEVA